MKKQVVFAAPEDDLLGQRALSILRSLGLTVESLSGKNLSGHFVLFCTADQQVDCYGWRGGRHVSLEHPQTPDWAKGCQVISLRSNPHGDFRQAVVNAARKIFLDRNEDLPWTLKFGCKKPRNRVAKQFPRHVSEGHLI